MRAQRTVKRTNPAEPRGWRILALTPLAILVAGCGPDEVVSYQAPKEQRSTTTAAGHPTAPSAASPRVTWKVPENWTELPGNQFRVGNFTVEDDRGQKAQITIIPLSGNGGGDLANVNRWRQQVGQPPISADEMEQATEKVTIAGGPGKLFDVAGQPPGSTEQTRILAAMVPQPPQTWYFKMTGDDALVTAQKPAFVEFLGNIAFGGTGPSAPTTSRTAPASASASSQKLPNWATPAGWKSAEPGSMQIARFTAGETDPAEVSVAALPGDGGGELANVNRWRRQLGLPPNTEEELAELLIKPEGLGGYVVDLKSDENGRRMVAAAVESDGRTWFYKLTGTTDAVEREKAAFLTFVQTAEP